MAYRDGVLLSSLSYGCEWKIRLAAMSKHTSELRPLKRFRAHFELGFALFWIVGRPNSSSDPDIAAKLASETNWCVTSS